MKKISETVERIEIIRDRFISISELSHKTGLSYDILMRWFRGEGEPSDRSLKRIALGTGCDLDWLRTGQGEPFPQSTKIQSGPNADAEQWRRIGLKLNQKLSDADRLAVCTAYIDDLEGLSREQRDLVGRALQKLSDPKARQPILEHLMALELIDQMHRRKP